MERVTIPQITATFRVHIYMSGPIEVAKQVIRAECAREGLCVTVDPTLFIYVGGEETGFVVGLLNYPRFPVTPDELVNRARLLMSLLLAATYQDTGLLVTPTTTERISR